MKQDWQDDRPLFSAPLVPGPTSWVQTYHQLTQWITPLLLIGVVIVGILAWEYLSASWMLALGIGLPISTILFHLLAVRIIAQLDLNRRDRHKMEVGRETLTVWLSAGEYEQFPLSQLSKIRWMYAGYGRAFRQEGPYASPNGNELTCQHHDRKLSYTFRLVSKVHHQQFQQMLNRWDAEGIDFEEYNQTSGLPVRVSRD